MHGYVLHARLDADQNNEHLFPGTTGHYLPWGQTPWRSFPDRNRQNGPATLPPLGGPKPESVRGDLGKADQIAEGLRGRLARLAEPARHSTFFSVPAPATSRKHGQLL